MGQTSSNSKPSDILRAEQLINMGFAAGLLMAGFGVVGIIMPYLRGPESQYYGHTSIWNLWDVGIGSGLAYGIYRKSRICAVLLLIYYLLDQIYIFSTGQFKVTSILWAFLFLWLLSSAILGAFRYHKLVPSKNKDTWIKAFTGVASGAALFGGLTTLIMILGGYAQSNVTFDAFHFLDVAVFWGLGFGIGWKKNRVCAVLMLLYHIWNRFLFGIDLSGLVFGVFYILGIIGTFAYQNRVRLSPPKPTQQKNLSAITSSEKASN